MRLINFLFKEHVKIMGTEDAPNVIGLRYIRLISMIEVSCIIAWLLPIIYWISTDVSFKDVLRNYWILMIVGLIGSYLIRLFWKSMIREMSKEDKEKPASKH